MALQPDFDLWSWFYQNCNEEPHEIRNRQRRGECAREFADKIIFLKNYGSTWNSVLQSYRRDDWYFLNSLYRAFKEHSPIVGFNYSRKLLPKPDLVKERMFKNIVNVSPRLFSQPDSVIRCPHCKSFLFRHHNASGFCENCGNQIE